MHLSGEEVDGVYMSSFDEWRFEGLATISCAHTTLCAFVAVFPFAPLLPLMFLLPLFPFLVSVSTYLSMTILVLPIRVVIELGLLVIHLVSVVVEYLS